MFVKYFKKFQKMVWHFRYMANKNVYGYIYPESKACSLLKANNNYNDKMSSSKIATT